MIDESLHVHKNNTNNFSYLRVSQNSLNSPLNVEKWILKKVFWEILFKKS